MQDAAETTAEPAAETTLDWALIHPDDYPDVEWCARCEVQVAVDGQEFCPFCSYDY
jgi:hypothetical protein